MTDETRPAGAEGDLIDEQTPEPEAGSSWVVGVARGLGHAARGMRDGVLRAGKLLRRGTGQEASAPVADPRRELEELAARVGAALRAPLEADRLVEDEELWQLVGRLGPLRRLVRRRRAEEQAAAARARALSAPPPARKRPRLASAGEAGAALPATVGPSAAATGTQPAPSAAPPAPAPPASAPALEASDDPLRGVLGESTESAPETEGEDAFADVMPDAELRGKPQDESNERPAKGSGKRSKE